MNTPSSSDGHRFTLRKSAKLRHRSLVENLFTSGKGIYEYPLRVVWRVLTEGELAENFRDAVPDRIGPLQMMVTVPKKKRRHAVDRVKMRRRIREAFRLNSPPLVAAVKESAQIRTISLAVVYQASDNLPYARVEQALVKILAKLGRKAGLDAAEPNAGEGASGEECPDDTGRMS